MTWERAAKIIDTAHDRAERGWGASVSHQHNVSLRVQYLGEAAQYVAMLHHILETPTTAADLAAAGFSPDVIRSVELVAQRPDETLRERVTRVRESADPVAVAAADITEDFDGYQLILMPVEQARRRRADYLEALEILRGMEPEPEPGTMLCPNCLSSRVVKLHWGYGTHEMMEFAEMGRFPPDAFKSVAEYSPEDDEEDVPLWHCEGCRVDFNWFRRPIRAPWGGV
jgi:hypothetical protein